MILNKDLESLTDLINYSDSYLDDLFLSTSSNQLLNNFLKNPYLFNFFKNFIKLYPSIDFLLINFENTEKLEIINFINDLKKSQKDFYNNTIKKETFYKLLYYINKNIFCLNI